ncbi:MAG: hypothetical protein GXY38_04125 [Planctomycetes bacterium]|jgi:protein tyrosine phosphatase (PTP) superfamily phosphohydrolase (DUF442 family)|nr:hypothetical protein [Planctomycetota bacterium]
MVGLCIRAGMLVLLTAAGCGAIRVTPRPDGKRPDSWAQSMSLPGLPNLFKVSDKLYRGGPPTAEGFKSLRELGIKTVISVRAFHDDSRQAAREGLDYIRLPSVVWSVPQDHIIRFLRIMNDPKRTPVFIYCMRGAERTGVYAAAYRVVLCGWDKQQAADEMPKAGSDFTSSGYASAGSSARWTAKVSAGEQEKFSQRRRRISPRSLSRFAPNVL